MYNYTIFFRNSNWSLTLNCIYWNQKWSFRSSTALHWRCKRKVLYSSLCKTYSWCLVLSTISEAETMSEITDHFYEEIIDNHHSRNIHETTIAVTKTMVRIICDHVMENYYKQVLLLWFIYKFLLFLSNVYNSLGLFMIWFNFGHNSPFLKVFQLH